MNGAHPIPSRFGSKAATTFSTPMSSIALAGGGSITVTMDDETAVCHLDPGQG